MIASLKDHDPPSVLLVDASAESREVLRTVLERRGVRIFEAREVRAGLALAQHHHPEVIVLDLDTETANDDGVQSEFAAETRDHHGSLVLLGKMRHGAAEPPGCVVAKPYHFAPLIHTIVQLIDQSRSAEIQN